MSRADMQQHQRRHHWLYLDEFQSFTTLSMANMLSELRKYHIGMCMAHQYLHQPDTDIQRAVLGNAGTLILFCVGVGDAAVLAKELQPIFDMLDMINLSNYDTYIKLMVCKSLSKAFSATMISNKNQKSVNLIVR